MYRDAQLQVQTQKGLTDEFSVEVGIHQANLSFNIFMNDDIMPKDGAPDPISLNDKVACLLYADHIVILSTTAGWL